MASAPQANLPVFYKDLIPLNSNAHGDWHARSVEKAAWVAGQHAIPPARLSDRVFGWR